MEQNSYSLIMFAAAFIFTCSQLKLTRKRALIYRKTKGIHKFNLFWRSFRKGIFKKNTSKLPVSKKLISSDKF